jgi:hypothetical protein
MRLDRLFIIGAVGALVMTAGCSGGETPAQAQKDVAEARLDAAHDVAEAKHDAAKDVLQEQKDVTKADAQGTYNVTVTRAEGDHKVAIEKCGLLTGSALKACKDQADADYDAAKARATEVLEASKPS